MGARSRAAPLAQPLIASRVVIQIIHEQGVVVAEGGGCTEDPRRHVPVADVYSFGAPESLHRGS